MKPYIYQFTKAVYGDNAELALASFNQQKFLEDATAKIASLEAENAKLRAVVEAAEKCLPFLMNHNRLRGIELKRTLESLETIK